ncbi:Envelope protein UL20 [Caprine alphaherpesvirus 1]|uniref:Envelope protein UL20 n=1 Tax=Caprine alphaherpesvirus 1 TaxID=39944 RepID=A0AAF1D207_9ALPH|nr:Envelope protein UL20 [Caprine alphaherpesvirus 1]QBM10880.1 Envelope protein UL20 [Caprine alphaherpesvirus 1]
MLTLEHAPPRAPAAPGPEGDAPGSDSEDDELLHCVTMSAYGGEADFLLRSPRLAPRADGRPAFTSHVAFYAASALAVKPACCLLFLYYYRTLGDATFVVAGAAATLACYARLAAAAGFLCRGVLADRLPFGRWRWALLAALAAAQAVAFAAIAGPPALAGRSCFCGCAGRWKRAARARRPPRCCWPGWRRTLQISFATSLGFSRPGRGCACVWRGPWPCDAARV